MNDGDGALAASNPKIKRLRRLSGRRSSRLDDGAFVIEGAVLVREAIAAGVSLEAIYVDAGHAALVTEFAELAADPTQVLVVAGGVLGSVLPAVSAQPVGAVAAATLVTPLHVLLADAVAAARPVLVLVDVADPGNVGTLLRAAESSGCAGVVVAGSGVDPYNPKVVRASAGSLFRLPVAVVPEFADLAQSARAAGLPTLAAVAREGAAHVEAPLGGAVAIVLGNEAHGLTADVVAACDSTVTVTMDGPAESLNVAMAGTVLCFEALRQRSVSATGRAGTV